MAVANDGTMLLHEAPMGWITRMRRHRARQVAASGTDKKRTDGGTARRTHELDHECQHTHELGPHAGQCKFIIKSDGTPGEGCKSAARWKKTNGGGGNGNGGGNGGGGNGGGHDSKRKADQANGSAGDAKRTKKVQVDGKTVVCAHCPTWSKNAACHPKCPLAAPHGRDHQACKAAVDNLNEDLLRDGHSLDKASSECVLLGPDGVELERSK